MKLSDLKLSPAQEYALKKLIKKGDWVTPYRLQEHMGVLNALVKRKLAKVRGRGALGAMHSPRTTIEYKSLVRLKN